MPRSRGVYFGDERVCGAYQGSSPLARGLQALASMVGMAKRIIPARAGFTRAIRAIADRTADHPRSRGVYGGGGARIYAL